MANLQWYGGLGGLNMDTFSFGNLIGAEISTADTFLLELDVSPTFQVSVEGFSFTYDIFDQLTGGTIQQITAANPVAAAGTNPFYEITLTPGVPGGQFYHWVVTNDVATAFATMLAGDDYVITDPFGTSNPDLTRGYAGADWMESGRGADTIFGGTGADTIAGNVVNLGPALSQPDGANYLRGDEGDDQISGGAGFDDINGNMGADLCIGLGGDDWTVGGKDNDQLYGDYLPSGGFTSGTFTAPVGDDIVYGNLGEDTCVGNAGDDLVRGGQGNDSVAGDEGADWLSGDRGDDTVTGGEGADVFHTFGEAGMDRVTDFNASQGDRVQLDPGTTYTAAQVGADTVITMGGGGQLILVGVQLSGLPPGWIFGA